MGGPGPRRLKSLGYEAGKLVRLCLCLIFIILVLCIACLGIFLIFPNFVACLPIFVTFLPKIPTFPKTPLRYLVGDRKRNNDENDETLLCIFSFHPAFDPATARETQILQLMRRSDSLETIKKH